MKKLNILYNKIVKAVQSNIFLTQLLISVILVQKIVLVALIQHTAKAVSVITTFFQAVLIVLMNKIVQKDILLILLIAFASVKQNKKVSNFFF